MHATHNEHKRLPALPVSIFSLSLRFCYDNPPKETEIFKMKLNYYARNLIG